MSTATQKFIGKLGTALLPVIGLIVVHAGGTETEVSHYAAVVIAIAAAFGITIYADKQEGK